MSAYWLLVAAFVAGALFERCFGRWLRDAGWRLANRIIPERSEPEEAS